MSDSDSSPVVQLAPGTTAPGGSYSGETRRAGHFEQLPTVSEKRSKKIKKKFQNDAFGRMLVGRMAEADESKTSPPPKADMSHPQHQQLKLQQEHDSSTRFSHERHGQARSLDEIAPLCHSSENDRFRGGSRSKQQNGPGDRHGKTYDGNDVLGGMLVRIPPQDDEFQPHQQQEGQQTKEELTHGKIAKKLPPPPPRHSTLPASMLLETKPVQRANSASTASTMAATTIASSVHSGVARCVSQPSYPHSPQKHLPRKASWDGGDTGASTGTTTTKSTRDTRPNYSLLSTFLESTGMATEQAKSIVSAFAGTTATTTSQDEADKRPHETATNPDESTRGDTDDDSALQGKKQRKGRSSPLDIADGVFVHDRDEETALARQGERPMMDESRITSSSADNGPNKDPVGPSDRKKRNGETHATMGKLAKDDNTDISDDTFKKLCRKEAEFRSQMTAQQEESMVDVPFHVEVDLAPLKRRPSREEGRRGSRDGTMEQQRDSEHNRVDQAGLEDDRKSSGRRRRSRGEDLEYHGRSSSSRSTRRPSSSSRELGNQGKQRRVHADQRQNNDDSDTDSKNVEVDLSPARRPPSAMRHPSRSVDGSARRSSHSSSAMPGRSSRDDVRRHHSRSATTNSEELVRALPVVMPQGPQVVVVEAESMPSAWRMAATDKNFRRFMCVVIPLVIIIAVVATLVVLLQNDTGGGASSGPELGDQVTGAPISSLTSTSTPTMAPTITAAPTANMEELQRFFEDFSGDTVYEAGSAPHSAILWLADKDRATTVDDIPLKERYALAVLYFATSGDTSWIRRDEFLNAALSVCGWHRGIFCETIGTSRLVRSIDLSKNGLVGTIPNEVGLLKELEHLHLGFNSISGSIPPIVGLLKSMKDLHLEKNSLSGSLPEEIQEMKSLVHLHISGNQLRGSLPEGFFGLDNLRTLDLSHNRLDGTLSEMIGGLESLSTLNIQSNSFTGAIPMNLSNLEMLSVLQMDNNQLSGKMPLPTVFFLRREIMTVANNRLSGSLPSMSGVPIQILSDVMSLRKLDLSGNSFTGTLSIGIGVARRIEHLDVSNNKFKGMLQPKMQAFENLEYLNMSNTQIGGTFQLDSQSLKILDIHNTNFSGNLFHNQIPSQLEYLNVGGTNIGGSILADIAVNGTNLRSLKARNCNLGGSIPAAVKNLNWLSTLDIGENSISGTLPPEMGSLAFLVSLRLDKNNISGSVPSAFANLKSLRNLKLEGNSMTGSIPSEICELKSLKLVHVDETVECSCCVAGNHSKNA